MTQMDSDEHRSPNVRIVEAKNLPSTSMRFLFLLLPSEERDYWLFWGDTCAGRLSREGFCAHL